MSKLAVIKTGGKQYLVKENDEIVVDSLDSKEKETIKLDVIGILGDDVELGTPLLEKKISATVIGHLKGEKIRIARFKAKSRYRRVKGFRAHLTKIKIGAIE